MDSVEYISTAGFNELRMIKRIGEKVSEGRPFLRRMFTLRVKFSFWTFFIVSMIIGVSFYYFDSQTSNQMYQHKNETVGALAKTIADQAAGYFINRRSDVEFDELIVSYRRANPELRLIVLTDEQGIIKAHSDDIHNIRKTYQLPPGVDGTKVITPQTINVNHENINYLIMPIKTGEKVLGEVHVEYSPSTIYYKLAESREKILILTTVMILFGILGIYLLSNYFVNPIVKITQRIRRFTSGDLETELPLEGAEEFFEISKGFNQMMTRLSQDRKNIVERERMAKEIEVASEIQKTLLPHQLPVISNLEVEAFYRAASVVGGDLYDIFQVSDHKYCLTVADVSGKGVPASLVMSMLRTVIQIQAPQAGSAKDTLIKVSNYLRLNIPPGMFITVFLVIYDTLEHTISFVSAGHNPMLYYDASNKEIVKINPRGMPLGMPLTGEVTFDSILEEVTLTLGHNDMFFIFTDGITEAMDREGKIYGMERLIHFMKGNISTDNNNNVKDFTNAAINELNDFCGFVKPNDDITFIVGKCNTGQRINHRQLKERDITNQINIQDRPENPV